MSFCAVKNKSFIHWFRRDLRLHDMPAITAALKEYPIFYPVYIFDESELQEDKIAYNRLRYILEALKDIDDKLRVNGGRLYVFRGNSTDIFSNLIKEWNISCLSYEEDILPTWKEMELSVCEMCKENGVEIITRASRTLWNPADILKANGGQPPVTYEVLRQVVELLGLPDRPEPDLSVCDALFNDDISIDCLNLPLNPQDLGIQMECAEQSNKVYSGGESEALEHLDARLKIEKVSLEDGFYMPNQTQPDILGPPMSMSAALSMGCLSVRRFYWALWDLHEAVNSDLYVPDSLMGQLLWREYFYAMCMNNPNFGTMLENPICLNIPWTTDNHLLQCWIEGKTGFPFIDAAMRQLRQEGWLHHVSRNAVACFLTRGDLWLSWEEGLKVFMKYLLDADFPVCAGNWMWVSSSAFENILQCPTCVSPISYGRHFEPSGNYIRKFVPELRKMPTKYIYEPWLAPKSVQEDIGCIIGKDYPLPVVNHQEACMRNAKHMDSIKESFFSTSVPLHCGPSSPLETRVFMWLPEKCIENLVPFSN